MNITEESLMNPTKNGTVVERIVVGKVEYDVFMEHISRYLFASKYVQNKKVLDIACGTGYGTKVLSKVAKEVYGVDIFSEAIEYAVNSYNSQNIYFITGDCEYIPFSSGTFDVVISFETIEHLNNPKKFLKEINRILKKDGLFLVSTPDKTFSQVEGPYHVKEFTREEFLSILNRTKFGIKSVYGQQFFQKTQNKDNKFKKYIKWLLDKLNQFKYSFRAKDLLEHISYKNVPYRWRIKLSDSKNTARTIIAICIKK